MTDEINSRGFYTGALSVLCREKLSHFLILHEYYLAKILKKNVAEEEI